MLHTLVIACPHYSYRLQIKPPSVHNDEDLSDADARPHILLRTSSFALNIVLLVPFFFNKICIFTSLFHIAGSFLTFVCN